MSSLPNTEEIPLPPNSESSTSSFVNNVNHHSSVDPNYLQSNYANYYSTNQLYNQQAAALYAAYQTTQSYNASQFNPVSATYPYYYSLNQFQQQPQIATATNQAFGTSEKLSRKQRKKLAAAAAAEAANLQETGEPSGEHEDKV